MLILSELLILQLSTFFYKVLQRSMGDAIFLHFSIISTLFIFCRKCNMLIYRLFRLVETCRTCRTGISMFCRETFFFWALPFRSGYAGVSSFRQLRSLTIPNAMKRRHSLSSGHLSADRDCPAERYNCTRHHGCTLFHCEVLPAVMAGGLSLLIGYSAARQTIIRYNCYILFALDFLHSRYLQSLAFPRLMRLFSHCKGKTRPLRTAALCKVTSSGFG